MTLFEALEAWAIALVSRTSEDAVAVATNDMHDALQGAIGAGAAAAAKVEAEAAKAIPLTPTSEVPLVP